MELDILRRRADAGDADALCTLAAKLVFGDGLAFAPEAGIDLLQRAARQGSGEALALQARLAAWGLLQQRDPALALDLLQRAAELGWPPAQAELRFLAHAEGADWRGLRAGVDLAGWTRAPPVRKLMERPKLRALDAFLAPAECDWLIALARGKLQPARVYRDSAATIVSTERTNSDAGLPLKAADVVLGLIRERISNAIGAGTEYFEVAQVLHYAPGQSFKRHGDFLDPASPGLAEEIRQLGQRVATLLIYLNDDYEAGETEFPDAPFRFKGRKGDALFFLNVDAAGAPDPLSVHAGLPPERGEKWVLSQWVRRSPINAAITPGASTTELGEAWLLFS